MPRREVDWQLDICKRLRTEGHFAEKWATQLKAGPPDLILRFARTAMEVSLSKSPKTKYWSHNSPFSALLEVKMERTWEENTTARTIGLTKLQQQFLQEWKQTGEGHVGVLVICPSFRDRHYPIMQFEHVPVLGERIKCTLDPDRCYEWRGP